MSRSSKWYVWTLSNAKPKVRYRSRVRELVAICFLRHSYQAEVVLKCDVMATTSLSNNWMNLIWEWPYLLNSFWPLLSSDFQNVGVKLFKKSGTYQRVTQKKILGGGRVNKLGVSWKMVKIYQKIEVWPIFWPIF